MKILFKSIFFLLFCLVFFSGKSDKKKILKPPFLQDTTSVWVDSVLKSLTLDEKIAQLFMVPAYSNELANNTDEIIHLVENHGIGGILFFQGTPLKQAKLTNLYQSKAKVPLLIAMDAEYGLNMRLDSTIGYPKQMALGAIQHDTLLYQMGVDLAYQMKLLGIHVNLAPVVDINTNPNNPVIQSRSLGENKFMVANKALKIMNGLQDNNVIATAKHFPGHGDTDSDSHLSLPVINHPKKRLEEVEFYPFKRLIDKGIGGVMIAHLYVPSLDNKEKMASTLSPIVVNKVLKKELGFEGLIYTDALNMKGVSESNKKGDIDMEAFMAGNDILLFPDDVPKGIKKIKKALKDNLITEREINKRVKKILLAKEWVGLNNYKPIDTKNIRKKLNTPKLNLKAQQMAEAAITVLNNKENLMPMRNMNQGISSISLGAKTKTEFQYHLELFGDVKSFQLAEGFSAEQESEIIKQIKDDSLVIIGVHNIKDSPELNWGIPENYIDLIKYLNSKKKVVVSIFGSPYTLKLFKELTSLEGLIVAYQDSKIMQQATAQAIFGASDASGKLPVTASPFYKYGDGIHLHGGLRFSYTYPEKYGIKSKDLQKIDSIANWGIDQRAYPGCQILIAKNQEVIYYKTFGHHTYEEKQEVKSSDLYDIASITKIAASVPSIMLLQQQGKVNLDYWLCDYLPSWVDETTYSHINLREMLAHQAGLKAWIPFYKETLISGEPKFRVYSIVPSETFPYRVADGLYIHKDYPDSLLKIILNTPLSPEKDYKYSDLGYFFLKSIIEDITNMPLNEYVAKNFYSSLGMATTTYLPRAKFPLDRIIPTEYDLMFRKQQIHGDVHDPGAAMQGGVGGHAGLFSSANDLAKLMQLYLNKGVYGGKRYFDEQIVDEFTKCQFCQDDNRRGAGFDKPVRKGAGGQTCEGVSLDSFGHSGFTGTLAWADPEEKIVYVFLSNRVYPSASNTKLIKLGIRTEIMEVIYDANEKSKKNGFESETSMK
jgi:beta-N-acetylhexosaminidase